MKIINKMIFSITIICYLWILIASFFFDSNVYYHNNSLISLGISLIIITIWGLIYYFLKKKIQKISKKAEIIFLLIFFSIVTLLQYVILKELRVEPGWDFGVVYNNALTFAQTGSRNNAVYIDYFQLFPNNISIFLLMTIAIKTGSIIGLSSLASIYLMNIIFIDASLIFLYLTVRKKYDEKSAIFSLILSFFFIALFLYTPIVYSDTLSLFVGILFIYLFTFYENNKINKKNIFLWILTGILLFIGKSLKVTSIIVLIALLINFFLKNKIKISILATSIILLSFLSINTTFNNIVVNSDAFAFKVNNYGSYPYTHWLMMGVEDKDADNSGRNSYGGYNGKDYDKTKEFKTGKEAQKYNISEYIRRVKKFGFIGYSLFLTKKNVNIWTDGYYFSDVKVLSAQPLKANSPIRDFLVNEKTKYIGIYFSQGVVYAFLIFLILGSLIKIKEKKYEEIDYIRLAILGLLIFLTFWEARSRYIVNFIPIFIIIIVDFYNIILNKNK